MVPMTEADYFILGMMVGVILGVLLAMSVRHPAQKELEDVEKAEAEHRGRVESISKEPSFHPTGTGTRPRTLATPSPKYRTRRISPYVSYAGEIQRVKSETLSGGVNMSAGQGAGFFYPPDEEEKQPEKPVHVDGPLDPKGLQQGVAKRRETTVDEQKHSEAE